MLYITIGDAIYNHRGYYIARHVSQGGHGLHADFITSPYSYRSYYYYYYQFYRLGTGGFHKKAKPSYIGFCHTQITAIKPLYAPPQDLSAVFLYASVE